MRPDLQDLSRTELETHALFLFRAAEREKGEACVALDRALWTVGLHLESLRRKAVR